MTDSLAEKAARAVEAWLDERGLVIRPREPTEEMRHIGVEAWREEKPPNYIYRAMSDAAPTPDTQALADTVLKVIAEGYDG